MTSESEAMSPMTNKEKEVQESEKVESTQVTLLPNESTQSFMLLTDPNEKLSSMIEKAALQDGVASQVAHSNQEKEKRIKSY